MVPEKNESGGVESLYQLAYLLNNLGKTALIYFENPSDEPQHSKFYKYNVKWVSQIEESKDNLLIFPEIWTDKLNNYKNINKAIWWLSVLHNWGKFQDFTNKDLQHFCQSYYAQHYLQAMNCYHSVMLNDFVDIDFSLNTPRKENIVCYNPAKGLDVTQEVIQLNKNINFVPIVGMTRLQTIDLLSRSKVYIDFGNHPGRDRLPREAAILNNCIITSLIGSARYFGDIPIPSQYKIEDINHVSGILNDCLLKYDERVVDFECYRRFISSQRHEMEMIVKRIFI